MEAAEKKTQSCAISVAVSIYIARTSFILYCTRYTHRKTPGVALALTYSSHTNCPNMNMKLRHDRPTDRPTDGRPDGRRDLKMFSGLAMLRACTYGNLLQRQPSSQAGLAGQASRARNSFLPASLNRLQGRSVRTTGMAYLYGLVQTMARPARDGFEFVGGTDGGGRGFSCTKCSSSQRLLLSICICEGKIRRAELRKKNNRVR